jgi:hypothetical protein
MIRRSKERLGQLLKQFPAVRCLGPDRSARQALLYASWEVATSHPATLTSGASSGRAKLADPELYLLDHPHPSWAILVIRRDPRSREAVRERRSVLPHHALQNHPRQPNGSNTTETSLGEGRLMLSSRARCTVAMIAANIAMVEAKRSGMH